jgi:hypothetical protein
MRAFCKGGMTAGAQKTAPRITLLMPCSRVPETDDIGFVVFAEHALQPHPWLLTPFLLLGLLADPRRCSCLW